MEMKLFRTFRGEGNLSHIRLDLRWFEDSSYSVEDLIQAQEICGLEDRMTARLFDESLVRNNHIGDFLIQPLPGNNLIGVITNKYLLPEYRRSPVSDLFRHFTNQVAVSLDLEAVICTVNKRNPAALRNAEKSLYREVGETKEQLIFLKDLKPLPEVGSYE